MALAKARLGANQVYSMRVWVNPDKMAKLGVTATDVSTAIQAQNRQNPAGNAGAASDVLADRFSVLRYSARAAGGSPAVSGHRAARASGYVLAAHR